MYREAYGKIRLGRKEGLMTVEMETSAPFAVAKSRGVELAGILHAGNCVSGSLLGRYGCRAEAASGKDF